MDTKGAGNLNFVAAWFGTCYFCLIFTVLLLIYLSSFHPIAEKHSNFNLYAALPAENVQSSEAVTSADARALIIANFFKGRESILVPYASEFVAVADKYGLDFRLLPAIALQESNAGKILPTNSNNPFGYGIYGGKTLHFNSWEEAIETVGQGLRENYLNQGLTTPYEIMTKYTPPSVEKGGPWAIGVSAFMEALK